MAAATDILLDTNGDGDLPIELNNFTIGYSDVQHVQDAMVSFPGEWKQYPQNGIGIAAFFKARVDYLQILTKIRQQLTNDGYTLSNPQVYQDADGIMVVEPNSIRL